MIKLWMIDITSRKLWKLAFRRSYSIAERTAQRLEVILTSTQEDHRGNRWGTLKTLDWSTAALKDHSKTLSIAQIATAHLLIRSCVGVITNSNRHKPCFHRTPRTITTKKYSWRKRCSSSDRLSWALRAVNIIDCRSSLTPATIT